MSGNKWWSTKVVTKSLTDLAIFSILSSEIPLNFHDSIRVVPLKHLTYFLAGINTKSVWNIPKEKYSAPLRILDLNELSKNFKAISTKELTSDKDYSSNLYQMLILLLILL